jgi:hypothetical protein
MTASGFGCGGLVGTCLEMVLNNVVHGADFGRDVGMVYGILYVC